MSLKKVFQFVKKKLTICPQSTPLWRGLRVRPNENCLFAITQLTLEKPTNPTLFFSKSEEKKEKKNL